MNRYRRRSWNFHPKGLQPEMKTDKDAISCIQMIMWYFINPSFCLTTLPRGGQRSDPAAGATAVSMPCSRTHQPGGLAIMSSASRCGRLQAICEFAVQIILELLFFFPLFKEIISLNKPCGECKVIPDCRRCSLNLHCEKGELCVLLLLQH